MRKSILQLLMLVAMTIVLVGLYGCGDSETNPPATKLTATAVSSAVTNGHTHTVSIPFSDLGTTTQVNYTTSTTAGHSHIIALSPQQFSDLKSGLRVIVTSTAAADGHTHTWEIQGGNVLYESICYNCHSNDKRGAAGMPGTSYTPLQSQRDALANPSAAPLSTAPAPNPTSTPTPSGTGTPDGAALYASNCAGCHGPLSSSTKRGRSVSQIKSAIASPSTGMGYLSTLTDAQIQAIATALQ